ncbi:uncharacterized protein V6R79_017606 [Siganus canaliculatus]
MSSTPSYNLSTRDMSGLNESFYDYGDDTLGRSLHIMALTVYSVAFVLGVLGNGVVIWVAGFKMKKTVNTVWFLNLAVADFIFTASLPLSITYQALGFHWPFGKFMCKLNTSLNSLNIFVSVYLLVMISVDRCVSVVWPVWAQNHRNVRKASFVSLGVWGLSLVLSIPTFVFRDTAPLPFDENIISCFNNFSVSGDETETIKNLRYQAMGITRFILGFFVPFNVIVFCYGVIIYRVRRNRTLASQSSRAFKIIAAVIIVFFLCWAPFHIIALIELANHTATNLSITLGYVIGVGIPISTGLAFINSCLNPILYVFIGQDFKDRVCKSILTRLETAFQDDDSGSHNATKSTDTSENKYKANVSTEV